MPFRRAPLRYAHTDGKTDVCYTDEGTIITCGTDGDLRTWNGIDDDDPSSKCVGEIVQCVIYYENRILLSTDINTVQSYTYPEFDKDGTEMRFTAPINSIKVNSKFIVAGSEDTEIKCVLKDKSESEFQLLGHSGPVIAIDLNEKHLLASYGGEGKIKIWDLLEKKEIKEFDGLTKIKTTEEGKLFSIVSFEPVKGNTLAYVKGKEIVVVSTSSWVTQFTLSSDEILHNFSCCQYSIDGEFMACGTQNGDIYVWDIAKQQTIAGEVSNSECQTITAIQWNPKNKSEFAYCDSSGQLGTIIDCLENSADNEEEDFLNNDAVEDNLIENDFDGINFRDNDVDNENCISLEKLKNETLKPRKMQDDGNYDDKNSDTKSMMSLHDVGERHIPRFEQQPPLQPGATPIDLENRYLVWNNVGIVRAHNQHSDDGSIDVEFHDVTVHHNLFMKNYSNHNIASLSNSVLALTSASSNKLMCIALASSGNREWSADMPNCEGILAITATDNLVAVCTDNRMLRIFSAMGTQREVISIPGPVVAICGRNDKLMVAFHSAPASEDQHISAILLQCFGLSLRTKEIRIPITPGKKITWIGYSDKGSPVCCDTMGLVQMYSTKTNCWYPICDTMLHAQSVSNNYYLVEILESSQIIQAVLCRGSSYPMTTPKPMIQEIQMQIPMCDIDSEKTILEESLVRWMTFNVENSEKLIKEAVIKLFSIACRSEMESRAKELIEMIASPSILTLAVKYASKLGRIHLSDKLSELLPQFEVQEKKREKEIQELEANAFNLLQSSPLPCTLLALQPTSKPSTPHIAPKVIRNPFKRSSISNSASKTTANPLSHLTEKVIGFESKKSDHLSQDLFQTMESEVLDTSIHGESSNNENKAKNENTPKIAFPLWFKNNKDSLEQSFPDLSEMELTKMGMKEYKSQHINKESMKRKHEDDDNTKDGKQSGISKLAKFGFKA